MSLQQKIDRITDILRRDDGISGAMHYTEQTSWILFLKFLDDYEAEKADDAILSGIDYVPVLDEEHRWLNWACPKTADGKLNIQQAHTGDDLRDYVNDKLFPYLKSFRTSARNDTQSFNYKIGAIFEYLKANRQKLSTEQWEFIQQHTFFGFEKLLIPDIRCLYWRFV